MRILVSGFLHGGARVVANGLFGNYTKRQIKSYDKWIKQQEKGEPKYLKKRQKAVGKKWKTKKKKKHHG
jgi:hypothetical protein